MTPTERGNETNSTMFSGEIVYLSISTESLTQGKYYLSSHQRTLNDCFQSAADHQGPTAVGQRKQSFSGLTDMFSKLVCSEKLPSTANYLAFKVLMSQDH